eukprot:1719034-Alexandrium_andersonii.AAC.1
MSMSKSMSVSVSVSVSAPRPCPCPCHVHTHARDHADVLIPVHSTHARVGSSYTSALSSFADSHAQAHLLARVYQHVTACLPVDVLMLRPCTHRVLGERSIIQT